MPELNKPITFEDIEEIFEAILQRQANFPQEPVEVTMSMVLMNIGDRYTKVSCIDGEWTGIKKDIPRGEGIPKCPNGHVLTQNESSLRLGWIRPSPDKS